MFFNVIVDKYGNKEAYLPDERVCDKCWTSDLSRFVSKENRIFED